MVKLSESERHRLYRLNNLDKYRRDNRERAWKKYGIKDIDKAHTLWDNITNCQLCGKSSSRLHIDHDHSNGEIRGILCRACNHGLGNFEDSPYLLAKAIVYLGNEKNT